MRSAGIMNNNKLIIATAGSGKTTYLTDEALKIKDENVLITTYTEANEEEIRKKIINKNGCVPNNIKIQTWFSFLLQHGVRPYQSKMHEELYEKKIGFFLTEKRSGYRSTNWYGKPIYWGEQDFWRYYFTKDLKIYSDKISAFIVKCNDKSNGEVISRISRIYPNIFIDEIQDLAGWELEILRLFFETTSRILLVGDPRQITYLTHHPQKNVIRIDGKNQYLTINEFIEKHNLDSICPIDPDSLKHSHRNNKSICDFSSKLFPEYDPSEPCTCDQCRNYTIDHEGIFLIKENDVKQYRSKFSPTELRWKNSEFPEWNFGKSKGMTFPRVLIYPTNPIKKWLKDNSQKLEPTSCCKFYVAITRARYSVAIVYNYADDEEFNGVEKYK